ncbi:MAG: hypothetical protein F6K65_42630 [Moorea sp. SIO3C2]|nr:hypothetical protein [Moorena sp. SIO3C2]
MDTEETPEALDIEEMPEVTDTPATPEAPAVLEAPKLELPQVPPLKIPTR